MKGISLLLNGIILFGLISCDKKDKAEIDIAPSFKALKNNSEWISTDSWANFSKSKKKFDISGSKKDPQYYQEEQLFFSFNLSDLSESNTVDQFYSICSYIIGGDAVSDSYEIDSAANNSIHISSIDTVEKQISGTFVIKLVRDKRRSDKGETMQFKEGHFNLNYREIE